ncbi:uracil-DNA glycosylase family protein [Kangiella sediminilitoris]|uniref:Uracil-DNA glycosylase superfamily n=1 Tax=Kangiella sediminilitoris TaxID=1144748 RepID=A0A1B3BDQ0_9GAMM|nr:uracil-DNA glycosylase family protein [Kangiella sediminilitoris]AOE50959.1 Uracil-DNA glycosylase superfamily [Kangiella sediminilitoris]
MTADLVKQVKGCTLCEDLPLGPKPIFQFNSKARILIAGQAPGRITHRRGRPFDDASGVRLRHWLGVDQDSFYKPEQFAILPMGFCYPGKGQSGDLPPRPECAKTWQHKLLKELKELELVVVIGKYALQWHLGIKRSQAITPVVKEWRKYHQIDINCYQNLGNGVEKTVTYFPLPHPSPRNNLWLKKNPWFQGELLPELRLAVQTALEN